MRRSHVPRGRSTLSLLTLTDSYYDTVLAVEAFCIAKKISRILCPIISSFSSVTRAHYAKSLLRWSPLQTLLRKEQCRSLCNYHRTLITVLSHGMFEIFKW